MVLAAATLLFPAAANAGPSAPQRATSTTAPGGQARQFDVQPHTITQGQPLTVLGTGCNPGDRVVIIFDTEPAGGDGTARADGSFRFSFVPALAPRTTTTFRVYAACREGVFTPAVNLTIHPATTSSTTGSSIR